MGALLDILRGKIDGPPPASVGTLATPEARANVVHVGRGSASASSIAWNTDDSRARTGWNYNTAAYRCIVTTASNLASVDLTVMTGDEETAEHPVARLWNTAGIPGMSARAVREVLFMRAERYGEAMAYLEGRADDPAAVPTHVHPLYDSVDVLLDGSASDPAGANLVGFRIKRAGVDPIPLLPDEVLWLRYPHPDDKWKALAPWKAALAATELDAHARTWQLGEFLNGAQPSHLIYLGDLEEAAYLAAKAEFATQVAGPGNAGKSMLTAGPVPTKAQRLTMTPAEMSYLESRKVNAADVMMALGYAPDYFQGQATYENRAASKTAVWSDLYLAKLNVLGSEVDRQLLPDPAETAAFDVSEVDALRESQDALVTRTASLVAADLVLIDEARAELGYDPLPDGLGQQTITPYRRQTAPEPVALPADVVDLTDGPPEDPPADAARLALPGPRAFRRIAIGGRVRVIRPQVQRPVSRVAVRATRRTPRTLSRPRVQAFYDAHEAIGQRALAKLIERQQRVTMRNLNKLRTSQLDTMRQVAAVTFDAGASAQGMGYAGTAGRAASDDLFDPTYWYEQTADATEPWLRGVWEQGGVQMAGALGLDFDTFDTKVLAAMDKRRDVLAQQVTATTRQALDSALIKAGAESGWSIDDLAEALTSVFSDLSDNRARTIARTETVGGYNGASNMTATESGVVTARSWLATKDARTRDSHAAMNGERVADSTNAYSNGLMFPGDPMGDPAETINCRCVELYDVED